jgi:hypothetical protein
MYWRVDSGLHRTLANVYFGTDLDLEGIRVCLDSRTSCQYSKLRSLASSGLANAVAGSHLEHFRVVLRRAPEPAGKEACDSKLLRRWLKLTLTSSLGYAQIRVAPCYKMYLARQQTRPDEAFHCKGFRLTNLVKEARQGGGIVMSSTYHAQRQ